MEEGKKISKEIKNIETELRDIKMNMEDLEDSLDQLNRLRFLEEKMELLKLVGIKNPQLRRNFRQLEKDLEDLKEDMDFVGHDKKLRLLRKLDQLLDSLDYLTANEISLALDELQSYLAFNLDDALLMADRNLVYSQSVRYRGEDSYLASSWHSRLGLIKEDFKCLHAFVLETFSSKQALDLYEKIIILDILAGIGDYLPLEN